MHKELDHIAAGPSSLGVPGVPGHTQILADQLTLYQPGGTDYAHLITTGTPRFSDLQTSLVLNIKNIAKYSKVSERLFLYSTTLESTELHSNILQLFVSFCLLF